MNGVQMGVGLFIVIIITALTIFLYEIRTDCIESGGTLVKKAFWFECVQP